VRGLRVFARLCGLAGAVVRPLDALRLGAGLREQAPGAVLVTREGDGHTSSWLRGRSRTRDAMVRYLITGRTPPADTVYPS
jgi:TAP-like protein